MKPIYWIAGIVLLLAVFLLTACNSRPLDNAAVVKIILENGHGSGFHLGNGVVITAAHVVGKNAKVKLRSDGSEEQDAEVLWVSPQYDIAYVRASHPERLGVAELSCRELVPGENIRAVGNPGPMEFVTAWGRVSGKPRKVGPWTSAYVTDLTIVPGQSGGPIFDDGGYVAGVVVGVMTIPLGFTAALVGVGYVVPSHDLCGLLGRDA